MFSQIYPPCSALETSVNTPIGSGGLDGWGGWVRWGDGVGGVGALSLSRFKFG